MRLHALLLALSLTWLAAADLAPTPVPTPLDPTRPDFDKLLKGADVVDSDYQFPYLISQTAYAYPDSAAELERKLRDFLKSTKLAFRGHFSKEGAPVQGLTKDSLVLPETAITGKDLDQVLACTAAKCGVKLTTKEAAAVQAAPEPFKLGTYESFIAERVRDFVREGKLRGFDERPDNDGVLAKLMAVLPFLSRRYPVAVKLVTDLPGKAMLPPNLADSFLRASMVIIESDRLQPILRVSEVLELREGGALLFVEVPIYTDHYLDSSLRVYEVFPVGAKGAIALTDVMELDELKKSGLIRALYKGRMEDAVAEAQAGELRRFRAN